MVTSPPPLARGLLPLQAPPVNQPANQDAQRRQQPYWQQFNPVRALPHISTDQVWQGLQASEELIPMVAPQLSHVTPLISVGYAGKDIYSTFNNVYKKTEDLPPAKRIRKIAADMGDVVLFHLFSTFLIPLLLVNKVGKWVKDTVVTHPRMPAKIAKHPTAVTAIILSIIAVITNKPVSKATDAVLEVTYRPLVEKRKREKLLKQQQEFLKQYERLRTQFPTVYQPYFAAVSPRVSPFAAFMPNWNTPPAKPPSEPDSAAKKSN